MEDADIAHPVLPGDLSHMSLFGVFDGHGGKEVALFCKEQVPPVFRKHLGQAPEDGDKLVAAIRDAITRTFHEMDDMLRVPECYKQVFASKFADAASGSKSSSKPRAIEMMEAKLKERVMADMEAAKRDGGIGKEEAEKLGVRMNMLKKLSTLSMEGEPAADPAGPAASCGCTAVCVVLTPKFIICANAGDSRAVLCRAGAAKALSEDHKPDCPGERRRIEAAGGRVDVQQAASGGRIQHRVRPGGLSLSRAIGDLQGKAQPALRPEEQVVCATPEVMVEQRSSGEDEFIVIACDGIWDVQSSSDVCNFVRERLLKGMASTTIIEELLDSCMCKDPKATQGLGGDNMTCIIVTLQEPKFFADGDDRAGSGKSKSCFPLLCGRGK